jgi:hypothetical protein
VQVTFNDPTLPPNTIYDGEIFGNCAVLDGDTPERYTVVTQVTANQTPVHLNNVHLYTYKLWYRPSSFTHSQLC